MLVAAIVGFLVGFYFIGELIALIAAATSAGIIFAVARPTTDDRSWRPRGRSSWANDDRIV